MENAEPLAADLGLLRTYQRQGLSMLGLVHFNSNHFADSATISLSLPHPRRRDSARLHDLKQRLLQELASA